MYIKSFWDFINHTKWHQKRVFLLGLWLHEKFPNQFASVPLPILDDFLCLHDQAKFSLVATQSGRKPITFIEHLYRFYGSNNSNAADFRPLVISKMNEIENSMANKFFASRLKIDLLQYIEIREKALLIEHIADLVDRGLCPVSKEEFGQELVLASDYLKEESHKEMAWALEKSYAEIVGDWTYEKQAM